MSRYVPILIFLMNCTVNVHLSLYLFLRSPCFCYHTYTFLIHIFQYGSSDGFPMVETRPPQKDHEFGQRFQPMAMATGRKTSYFRQKLTARNESVRLAYTYWWRIRNRDAYTALHVPLACAQPVCTAAPRLPFLFHIHPLTIVTTNLSVVHSLLF